MKQRLRLFQFIPFDEIFVGYFEDSEALQENEPTSNDPRLTQPIGIYRNLGQTDQKPTHLLLRLTEIPIPPRAPKGEGLKQYVLPEPILEVNSPLSKVKQEIRRKTKDSSDARRNPTQDERQFESERLTADGIIKIVEHDPIVLFRGSSIPLSTDFAERVLPLISNQMGPAPSRFRNDDQEQVMRTVANENWIKNGSTNDPNPTLTDQVSTKENRVDIPEAKHPKFTGSTENRTGYDTGEVSTIQKGTAKTDLPTIICLLYGFIIFLFINMIFLMIFFKLSETDVAGKIPCRIQRCRTKNFIQRLHVTLPLYQFYYGIPCWPSKSQSNQENQPRCKLERSKR